MVRVLFALVVMTTVAHAGDELAWTAPDTCPTADDVRARIEQRLGASLDGVMHGVAVEVARGKAGFTATIDLRGVTLANGVRTLTASSCDELADAVALIVARVASEARQAHAAEPTTVATVAPPPEAAPAVTKIEVPREPAPVPRLWAGGVHLSGLSGVGGVPEVGIGAELAGYVRRGVVYGELAGAHWVRSRAYVQEGAPARVDVDLDLAILRVGWGSEELPIRSWLTAEVGRMTGRGVDLANPQLGSGRWTAAGAGFGVAWPMAPWARIIGTVEFVVPFERVHFVLEGGNDVYRSWPLSARATFGVEFGRR